MKVKELARIFNISIADLVRESGYSKQGLYNVLEGKQPKLNEKRYQAFINHMKYLTIMKKETEQKELNERHQKRLEAIETLKGGANGKNKL